MKKHDEGYALPFVLVVLVALCIIAVGIMDFSLRNLESQQATIQRIKEKYVAAAKIEEIYAAAENNVIGATFPSSENVLLFLVESGTLKIAAAGSEGGDLWIIAELKPKNATGEITLTFGQEDKPETLTIGSSDTKSIEIVTYRIVDRDTALAYVGRGGGN